LRQELANDRALGRIVVEEDQRFEAESELVGERFDVGSLVFPVRLEDGEMLFAQQHLGMLAEGRARNIVVVLGRDSEHNSAFAQRQRVPLNAEIRFAGCVTLRELNAFEAIVADDAAPKRVVEIHHQNATALAAKRRDDARNMIRIERNVIAGKRQLG
jgi:hypothetical protein